MSFAPFLRAVPRGSAGGVEDLSSLGVVGSKVGYPSDVAEDGRSDAADRVL